MRANSQSVIVALGSNLASATALPAEIIEDALRRLKPLSLGAFRHSSLWSTPAQDCEPGMPDFVNAIALFNVPDKLNPHQLLASLRQIEDDFGRTRGGGTAGQGQGYQARTLDLDLICYGEKIIDDEILILPHPRAHLRSFVLGPLAELDPQRVLPGQLRTVRELESSLKAMKNPLFAIKSC